MCEPRKYISDLKKKIVLERQNNKCANNPDKPALNLENYNCLLWICYDGDFDDAGCQFDHINEFSISKDNSLPNIQALCPNCHSVKSKKCANNKFMFTTTELAKGRELMKIDKPAKKRKLIDL
jgi:5-methylcytosine-specific restriction endonuclease McrA